MDHYNKRRSEQIRWQKLYALTGERGTGGQFCNLYPN